MRGSTIGELARQLKNYYDRPVLDATGLTQKYNVSMKFARNLDVEENGESLPSLTSALKAAGLILTRGEGPVDVLVVDQHRTAVGGLTVMCQIRV